MSYGVLWLGPKGQVFGKIGHYASVGQAQERASAQNKEASLALVCKIEAGEWTLVEVLVRQGNGVLFHNISRASQHNYGETIILSNVTGGVEITVRVDLNHQILMLSINAGHAFLVPIDHPIYLEVK